jgi:hypothetical protein
MACAALLLFTFKAGFAVGRGEGAVWFQPGFALLLTPLSLLGFFFS